MGYRMPMWSPLCGSGREPEQLTIVVGEVFTCISAKALIDLLTELPANVAVRVQFRPGAVIDSQAAAQLLGALSLSPTREVHVLGLAYERQHPVELPVPDGVELKGQRRTRRRDRPVRG